MWYNKQMKRGFTVIEILVVIGIIVVLTAIILPSLMGVKAKNRDTERIADIADIQMALAQYKNKYGVYPDNLDVPLFGGYITEDGKTPPNNELGYEYQYVPLSRSVNGSCTYYHLGAPLESGSGQIDQNDDFDSTGGDNSTQTPSGYYWCGGYSDDGIDGTNPLMYDVHP